MKKRTIYAEDMHMSHHLAMQRAAAMKAARAAEAEDAALVQLDAEVVAAEAEIDHNDAESEADRLRLRADLDIVADGLHSLDSAPY